MIAKPASFSFVKYKFTSFSFKESETSEDNNLEIHIEPRGKYNNNTKIFKLFLKFKGEDKNNTNTPVIESEGVFIFKLKNIETFDDIPDYFYPNSIAIVFPYLRSFVSTLTLQSNTGVMMLGLIKTSDLSHELKENTIIE